MTEPRSRCGLEKNANRRFEDEVVAVERAFAIRVAYDGIREAFLSVLAEDSIICGDGPESGRPAYEALPKDHPGRLMWEPAAVAASADGSLAFTSGPYRFLDNAGHEKSTGVYFSVWRRNRDSGHFELVLDFGTKGIPFPETGSSLLRLGGRKKTGKAVRPLRDCLETGGIPSPEGALCLGPPPDGSPWTPSGYFHSSDGELGVLWGARRRTDGSQGASAILVAANGVEEVALAFINA